MKNSANINLKAMNQGIDGLTCGIENKYNPNDLKEFMSLYNIDNIDELENFECLMDSFIKQKIQMNSKQVKSSYNRKYTDKNSMMHLKNNNSMNNVNIFKNNEAKEELMMLVMKYQLAVLDTALYLDTHPNDPIALVKHNEYSTKLNQYKAKYSEKFGPFDSYTPDMASTWRYIDSPWPWEQNFN